MINFQELQAMTDEAIRRANEEREAALAQERAEAERVRRANELKAEGILEQVPNRCATEARAGRNHAIVMSLKYDDFDRGGRTVANLTGVARIVHTKLAQMGLPTKVESWEDGYGTNGGHNLLVHW